MPFLPPELIALLLAIGAFCGVMMMIGIRMALRRDLEPMSRQGRWLLFACLTALAIGATLVYFLVRSVLDI